jgi:hypothetical protein
MNVGRRPVAATCGAMRARTRSCMETGDSAARRAEKRAQRSLRENLAERVPASSSTFVWFLAGLQIMDVVGRAVEHRVERASALRMT